MRLPITLLPLLLGPFAAAAAPLALSYDGSLAGVRMIHAEARLQQDAAGYQLTTTIHTVGAFAALVRGKSDVLSQGVWQAGAAAPRYVDSEGYWNGRQRRLIVDYRGGTPAIKLMVPPDPHRTAALDRDATQGSTDILGLLVGLIRQVDTTGGCDHHVRVFDGRGVTEFTMTTSSTGPQPGLAASALRCDFTTRKIAGLRADENPKRIDHGYALFAAPAAGLPHLPVRIVFQTRWAGDAVLSLTDAHVAAS